MARTTISSGYRVVIPKAVREQLGLRPGQKLSVILKGGVVHLVPVPELKELRGLAKGANVGDIRGEADRW